MINEFPAEVCCDACKREQLATLKRTRHEVRWTCRHCGHVHLDPAEWWADC